ncbi:MAG: hypothetical protein AAFY34_11835 [Pseudomonadota bacterium]
MSERDSFDYYMRFAEVTEQLMEALSQTIPDIPSENQALDEEIQKALWITQSLIRRWRESARMGPLATESEAVSASAIVGTAPYHPSNKSRIAGKK